MGYLFQMAIYKLRVVKDLLMKAGATEVEAYFECDPGRFSFGSYEFKVYVEEHEIDFSISQFPGGCSWIVLHDLYGRTETKIRMAKVIAKYMNYSHIIISDNKRYCASKGVPYTDLGFKLLHTNVNPHSENTVYMYIMEV